ncbi:MAG TPA: ExeM/NucH family extracellular endonuclease [Woeseiaceae bacterium]|nr:ExeM/NucH family extracellular endonuclease [Woeseiaceae bacterium]
MRLQALVIVCCLLPACGDSAVSGAPASAHDRRVTVESIQGRGVSSPYAGREVTVDGVVSGDFQDADADRGASLGGFFLQSGDPDDDPATPDGVFVDDREASAPDVRVGDTVRVAGTVVEYFGETRIRASRVQVTGSGRPRETKLALPAAGVMPNGDGMPIADLERFEGMRVRVTVPLYIQDLYTLERFGDLLLASEARQQPYTAAHPPDAAGFAAWQERLAAARLVLDDGQALQNVSPVRYLFPDAARPGWSPRVGDRVDGLVGMLRYSRGSGPDGTQTWRLLPLAAPHFTALNPRSGPPQVGGEVVVASFNVLNFFATVDRGDDICGPRGRSGCRGADSPEEFSRQLAKTVTALQRLDAAIVGLMEIENGAATGALVGALNASAAQADWRQVDTGIIGDDAIRVALIYRAGRVEALGRFAVLDRSVDARFDSARNRPALAQTFRARGSGGRFTVSVNHLKSKGSSCDDAGDRDLADGQGNCSATRRAAAAALADWLARDPTGSGDADFLVIGDLNAYAREEPLQVLENAGLVDLVARDIGAGAYSFVFDGRSGTLDHALASVSLARQVTGTAEWHSNADEPPAFDYNLEHGRNAALFRADSPWRASDHDPLLIGLALDPD